jgi:hypothetical protein
MPPNGQLAVLAAVALALIALVVWIALRVKKANPEKREKRRRLLVHRTGRLGDALVLEVSDEATSTLLYYTYTVHGVEYNASQDISTLKHLLPAEPGRFVGVAHLKYALKNPANSILICEEWSGLRARGVATSPLI